MASDTFSHDLVQLIVAGSYYTNQILCDFFFVSIIAHTFTSQLWKRIFNDNNPPPTPPPQKKKTTTKQQQQQQQTNKQNKTKQYK